MEFSIAQLVRDQRTELEESLRTFLVKREAEKHFGDIVQSSLIKVVSGVRRCGKSVFIHQLLKDKSFAYINFDDERLIEVGGDNVLSSFYEVYGSNVKYVFIDEVQNLKNWELFANRLHRLGFNLFLTGSNAKLLSKELATHLTGRHIKIELLPFSFKEFLLALNFSEDIQTTKGKSLLKQKLNEYLQMGGFPEIVVKKENPRIYLGELYRSIVSRDIISRYSISYKKTFREIAQTLLSSPGRRISYNKLKNHFGLGSVHTVKNYVSYLEEAYLLFSLNRFSYKPVEEEKSDKKIYVVDNGLVNYVAIKSSPDYGQMYENTVAIELLRRKYLNQQTELYYWKNILHEEVDFIIKQNLKVQQLIQVCWNVQALNVKEREVKALLKASKELKCNNLLIITEDYEAEEKTKNKKIKYIPLWKWLLINS